MRSLVHVSPLSTFFKAFCFFVLSSNSLGAEILGIYDKLTYSNRVWFEDNGVEFKSVQESYSGQSISTSDRLSTEISLSHTPEDTGDTLSHNSRVAGSRQNGILWTFHAASSESLGFGYHPTIKSYSNLNLDWRYGFRVKGDGASLIAGSFDMGVYPNLYPSFSLIDLTLGTVVFHTKGAFGINYLLFDDHEYAFNFLNARAVNKINEGYVYAHFTQVDNIRYVSAPASFFLYAFGLLALFRKAKSFKKSI